MGASCKITRFFGRVSFQCKQTLTSFIQLQKAAGYNTVQHRTSSAVHCRPIKNPHTPSPLSVFIQRKKKYLFRYKKKKRESGKSHKYSPHIPFDIFPFFFFFFFPCFFLLHIIVPLYLFTFIKTFDDPRRGKIQMPHSYIPAENVYETKNLK